MTNTINNNAMRMCEQVSWSRWEGEGEEEEGGCPGKFWFGIQNLKSRWHGKKEKRDPSNPPTIVSIHTYTALPMLSCQRKPCFCFLVMAFSLFISVAFLRAVVSSRRTRTNGNNWTTLTLWHVHFLIRSPVSRPFFLFYFIIRMSFSLRYFLFLVYTSFASLKKNKKIKKNAQSKKNRVYSLTMCPHFFSIPAPRFFFVLQQKKENQQHRPTSFNFSGRRARFPQVHFPLSLPPCLFALELPICSRDNTILLMSTMQ